MSVLGPTKQEHEYLVKNTQEAFKLIGQDALLYQLSKEDKDFYRDLDLEFKIAVPISLVFEDNPKPILKKYNWLIEDEELPYIVYIVKYDNELKPIDIRENMVIQIPSIYDLETKRNFRITNIRANHIDPITYLAKLVPYRPKVNLGPDEDYKDTIDGKAPSNTTYSYLKVKK